MVHINVISYKKGDYPESDNFAILSINCPKKIKNQDDLVNAINEKNAYSIEYLDGICVYKGTNNDDTLQSFRIDFFDEMNGSSLSDYLANPESDYRLTCLSDGIIIRVTNSEYKEIVNRSSKTYGRSYIVGYSDDSAGDKLPQKRKSLFDIFGLSKRK